MLHTFKGFFCYDNSYWWHEDKRPNTALSVESVSFEKHQREKYIDDLTLAALCKLGIRKKRGESCKEQSGGLV